MSGGSVSVFVAGACQRRRYGSVSCRRFSSLLAAPACCRLGRRHPCRGFCEERRGWCGWEGTVACACCVRFWGRRQGVPSMRFDAQGAGRLMRSGRCRIAPRQLSGGCLLCRRGGGELSPGRTAGRSVERGRLSRGVCLVVVFSGRGRSRFHVKRQAVAAMRSGAAGLARDACGVARPSGSSAVPRAPVGCRARQ